MMVDARLAQKSQRPRPRDMPSGYSYSDIDTPYSRLLFISFRFCILLFLFFFSCTRTRILTGWLLETPQNPARWDHPTAPPNSLIDCEKLAQTFFCHDFCKCLLCLNSSRLFRYLSPAEKADELQYHNILLINFLLRLIPFKDHLIQSNIKDAKILSSSMGLWIIGTHIPSSRMGNENVD